mgnify:CR=1 FL=1
MNVLWSVWVIEERASPETLVNDNNWQPWWCKVNQRGTRITCIEHDKHVVMDHCSDVIWTKQCNIYILLVCYFLCTGHLHSHKTNLNHSRAPLNLPMIHFLLCYAKTHGSKTFPNMLVLCSHPKNIVESWKKGYYSMSSSLVYLFEWPWKYNKSSNILMVSRYTKNYC